MPYFFHEIPFWKLTNLISGIENRKDIWHLKELGRREASKNINLKEKG